MGHGRASQNSAKPGACLLSHETSRGQVTKRESTQVGRKYEGKGVRKPATQSRYSRTQ